MARGAFSASNFFSYASDTLVSAFPFTLAIWFKPSTLTACCLIGYGDQTTTTKRWTLEMNVSGNARCSTTSINGFTGFNSPNAISAGSWAHFCAIWASDTDRRVFLNGTKGTDTTFHTFETNSAWQWRIGERSLSVSGPADGHLAEAGIWTAALTDEEVMSLAKKFRPPSVRPQSLVSYMDLVRPNRDRMAVPWTENGTVPVQNHAPVY